MSSNLPPKWQLLLFRLAKSQGRGRKAKGKRRESNSVLEGGGGRGRRAEVKGECGPDTTALRAVSSIDVVTLSLLLFVSSCVLVLEAATVKRMSLVYWSCNRGQRRLPSVAFVANIYAG